MPCFFRVWLFHEKKATHSVNYFVVRAYFFPWKCLAWRPPTHYYFSGGVSTKGRYNLFHLGALFFFERATHSLIIIFSECLLGTQILYGVHGCLPLGPIHTYLHTLDNMRFKVSTWSDKKIKLLYLSAPMCGNWFFTSYILTKEMKRSVGMESHLPLPDHIKKIKW
jgi:hypothetical protein